MMIFRVGLKITAQNERISSLLEVAPMSESLSDAVHFVGQAMHPMGLSKFGTPRRMVSHHVPWNPNFLLVNLSFFC